MAQANSNSVATFSEHIWRPSSLKQVGTDRITNLSSPPRISPETPNEAQFFELPSITKTTQHKSEVAKNSQANAPTTEGLVSSMQKSDAQLKQSLAQYSPNDYRSIPSTSISDLLRENPVAHDRLVALPSDQRDGVVAAGKPHSLTMLIPKPRSSASGSGLSDPTEQPEWEEIFSSVRSPSGATDVVGKRLHNGEWYQFGSRISTPANSDYPNGHTKPMRALSASTTFAQEKLLGHTKPGNIGDLDPSRVIRDVRGITEGPWKPFLQGNTLKGSEHKVQGVQPSAGAPSSSPNALQAFTSQFDSIKGVLSNIQQVANGIQKAADFLGLAGELGQFGDVLSWIGAFKLPKSPADLINSLLKATGILPAGAESPHGLICLGSGEGGLVVTKGGAAAEAFGKGLVNQVGVMQSGDGAATKQVEAMIKKGTIKISGSPEYVEAVKKDLVKIASTKSGKELLESIDEAGHQVEISAIDPNKKGNSCRANSTDAFPPPEGTGKGTGSDLRYDPFNTKRPPGSPNVTGLNHELGHADHNAHGVNSRFTPHLDPTASDGISNKEEGGTIANVDNPFRAELGLPPRKGHGHLP